jgi:hypothetical protein
LWNLGFCFERKPWIASPLRAKCWGKCLDRSWQCGILLNEEAGDTGLYTCRKSRDIKKIAMGWICESDEIGKVCLKNVCMEVCWEVAR